ncbi:hypothetical protein T5B8_05991 [Salinisphaera sp. T5B8]|uniref:NERD domain-containing protein n=1 Tax=Salinisphaera sp. T5B8 TaxID=1304154 RepID=UPI00334117A5
MKALISLELSFRREYASVVVRLSRWRAALAWWWMLRSRRYIVLRNLAVQTPGALIHLGLVLVSTRGLFIIEPLDAGIAHDLGSTDWAQRPMPDAANDADPVERCEQQAQELAELLEENRSFVSPVLVTVSDLPAERPANMVHGPELAEYIRSYRVEVFSARRLQQIVTQLSGQTPAQLKTAA